MSVPVLSVLIALVAPRVSTSVRFFTTAFASASCFAPSDSNPETNAGMPVGIAEIAIAVPSSSSSSTGVPRAHPITTMKATAVHAMIPITFVSESSSCCSGDRVRVTEVSIVAICPISVRMPVAVTTIAPVPRVTDVFWNSMFERSPMATSPARTPGSFGTGALSPVRAASCASRVAERRIRPSAGTMSPASRDTMSPGTRSAAGTSVTSPSRSTFAWGIWSFDSASTLARALSSCRAPSTTFSAMRSPTMMPVEISPIRKLTTVTPISMMFMGLRSWARATAMVDGGFSPAIAFGPRLASRAAASAAVSPLSASDASAATTSLADRT